MNFLPVDSVLSQIHSALQSTSTVIIQAPPGSGKSTRIPISLLKSELLNANKVLLLEPRRLAAVNLASWISSCIGEEVGGSVGYSIRFERRVSARTRLEIVTEGVLTRRLQNDPFLEAVGIVIFDEFHERSIHTDTALALCLYLQRTVRPELKILIMSATLDIESLKTALPAAKIVTCAGRAYPVEVRYLGAFQQDIAKSAANAVGSAIKESQGDILVFLPGSGEIRRCLAMLQQQYSGGNILLLPLYGDLSFSEQQRAITPADRRKVVLSTNIAETSLTIEGIRVVIDSGLARRSRFDPSRALDRLVTERISKASAIQRSGRSGRTAPGVCYRLWSEAQQQSLLQTDKPEILTSDLCDLALNLALWGIEDITELPFPDTPPLAALTEARRVLRSLSAIDEKNRITAKGRAMGELPLHPRIAALLLAAIDLGQSSLGADVAAILSERNFYRSASKEQFVTSSDLLDQLEILIKWRKKSERFRSDPDLNISLLKMVDRLSGQLKRITQKVHVDYQPEIDSVSLLAATAFPDRIARQREAGSGRYLLANGRGGVLDPQSGVLNQEFIVATRMDAGTSGDGRIFSASALSLQQIKTSFSVAIYTVRSAVWDPALKRINASEAMRLGAITLEKRIIKAGREDVITALKVHLCSSADSSLFIHTAVSDQYSARVEFLRHLFPDDGWPDLSCPELCSTAEEWLPAAIDLLDKPERFSGFDMLSIYKSAVGWKMAGELDRLAPVTVSVPSASLIRIDYTSGGEPLIAVKLQELFGLAATPTIAGGKYPLLIHLLSPAGRPIQVTRDLNGFWNGSYHEVKKELKGRYPKHPWPDDPWSAMPTRHTKKKMS